MKLAYKTLPESMAGGAVSGVGTIHKCEVAETLTNLSNDLELPFDFGDFAVGSAGKREYSGDIDVVVDNAWWDRSISAFRENLEEAFGKENVARHGAMLHLKYPIANFHYRSNDLLPRTGFVQVDFLFGDYKWLKFYHFCDGNSAYKGAHRNLMISAICAEIDVISCEDETTNLSRLHIFNSTPANYLRWKWGQHGFSRVRRQRIRSEHGNWLKKSDDIIIGPFFDPKIIIDALFPEYKDEHALDSLETLMMAVKKNYGLVEQEKVWRKAAMNFLDWSDGKNFNYPAEINKYFPINDK